MVGVMPKEEDWGMEGGGDQIPAGDNLLQALIIDDLRDFIANHNLDDSARTKLESCTLEQQVDVISQDSGNVRNMNAVVISRANKSQKQGPQFTGAKSHEYVTGLVDRFIDTLQLDEKASAGLRALPPKYQVSVMARDMGGVTNPSGVVDSRVRKLLREGDGYLQASAGAHLGSANMAKTQSANLGPMPTDATQFLEQAYQAFITEYNIDQRAQDLVAMLMPLEKLEVISDGMDNVWNPSGTVASRAIKVKGRQVILGKRAEQWISEVAALFCQSNGIDETADAWALLGSLPADKKFEVCSQSLAGARNPGSVLYCRIQKLGYAGPQGMLAAPRALPGFTRTPVLAAALSASAGGAAGGHFGGSGAGAGLLGNSDVERFCMKWSLDERAKAALRDLAASNPAGAQEVMMQPITEEVRNPSGVIHARVMQKTGMTKSRGFGRARPY
mmetsp:Transcript_28814/g.56335  ORF Transcript_28814/g.56335 Transcript_28814/m.56335 type:complete len:445 (+) Transcript_28814:29-1363(+)